MPLYEIQIYPKCQPKKNRYTKSLTLEEEKKHVGPPKQNRFHPSKSHFMVGVPDWAVIGLIFYLSDPKTYYKELLGLN